jgi:glutamyl-tRNA synthetase
MILGADGERLSKRHGAVSVMQYPEDGYLPEALVNYLARLGWSHGDEEIFSKAQLVEWFDLKHVNRAPAHFDPEKLRWLNQQYMIRYSDEDFGGLIAPRIERRGGNLAGGPRPAAIAGLLKTRSHTIEEAAAVADIFYQDRRADAEELKRNLTDEVRPALGELATRFSGVEDWNEKSVMESVHAVMDKYKLKLPKIAMPLRLVVFGVTQTPNLGPALEHAGKARVIRRLREHLSA